MIFTSEKLDKSDNLVDLLHSLKINNDVYYEYSKATTSNAQDDLTLNPKIVTHTSNRIFKQKVLSNQTIPVVPSERTQGLTKVLRQLYWRHGRS